MASPSEQRLIAKFSPVIISISLESQSIDGALIDERGRLITRRRATIKPKTVRALVTATITMILELAARSERDRYAVQAIGVNVEGVIDYETDRVSFTDQDGYTWQRVPLRALIEAGLEDSGVDIRLPHSASPHREAKTASAHPHLTISSSRDSQVAAEVWCGAATGKRNVVTLIVADTLSMGFWLDGKIIHGARDLAGNIAWLSLSETRASEEPEGSLAFELNEAALVRKTLERWTRQSDSVLSQLVRSDPSRVTAATVLRAAQSEDPFAMTLVSEHCQWLGRVVANTMSLLNPEVIVLGGGFGVQLKPFLGEINTEAKRWAFPPAFKQSRLIVSRLGDKAKLLGTARLATTLLKPA